MNPNAESKATALAHRPEYLPWYFHVGLMLVMLLTAYFLLVSGGEQVYFVAWSAISPGIVLAVAGKGNRWLFSAILLLWNVLVYAAVAWRSGSDTLAIGLVPCLLWCVAVALWPALLLWIAHSLNRRRRGLEANGSNVTDKGSDA